MFKHSRKSVALLFAASILPTLSAQAPAGTTTPIKYVVVIFNENNSFDHYFGAYPNALFPNGAAATPQNPFGESPFSPLPNTPSVNGLTPALNKLSSTAPFRLDRSLEVTCDNDNHYKDEQTAYNSGIVNLFPATTSATGVNTTTGDPCTPSLSMGYYDGNTVTALWNYAQYFAMSDNFFDTEFGTTVMGHLNLLSGQTHTGSTTTISGKVANGSVIANVEAGVDDCVSAPASTPVK